MKKKRRDVPKEEVVCMYIYLLQKEMMGRKKCQYREFKSI